MAKAISPKADRHRARQLLRQKLVGAGRPTAAGGATAVADEAEALALGFRADEEPARRPLE